MTKCVHTEHCCVYHGCKYGDDDCPVWLGIKPQSYGYWDGMSNIVPIEECISLVTPAELEERRELVNYYNTYDEN